MLLAYDLRTDKVAWTRTYTPGVDSLCVTPDGSKIYMSSGEHAATDYFFVLDASDGDVARHACPVAPQTHNAVLQPRRHPRLPHVDHARPTSRSSTPADDHVIRRVGPFGDSIRPFTINGRNTLAIVNVNRLIGFEVGDIATGQKLWRVTTPGYPYDGAQLNPSHGVALTPDEREVWVVDSQNKALHVFDVTGLPDAKPTKVATITLTKKPVLDHLQPRRPLRVPRHRRRDRHRDADEGRHDRRPGVQAGAGRRAGRRPGAGRVAPRPRRMCTRPSRRVRLTPTVRACAHDRLPSAPG